MQKKLFLVRSARVCAFFGARRARLHFFLVRSVRVCAFFELAAPSGDNDDFIRRKKAGGEEVIISFPFTFYSQKEKNQIILFTRIILHNLQQYIGCA